VYRIAVGKRERNSQQPRKGLFSRGGKEKGEVKSRKKHLKKNIL
jgi:hypothetical protein